MAQRQQGNAATDQRINSALWQNYQQAGNDLNRNSYYGANPGAGGQQYSPGNFNANFGGGAYGYAGMNY